VDNEASHGRLVDNKLPSATARGRLRTSTKLGGNINHMAFTAGWPASPQNVLGGPIHQLLQTQRPIDHHRRGHRPRLRRAAGIRGG
jgi:hypothetical protein